MRKVENANQTAGGSFNNYQFDFGLGPGLSKGSSNAPLKDQKPSGSYSSPWSKPVASKPAASQASGWSQYQSNSGSGWASQSKSAGGAAGGGSTSWGGGSSTTAQTWAGYKPMTQPLGGSKPASQSLGGGRPMSGTTGGPAIGLDTSKFAAAGIAGVTETRSADVFGELLGAAMNRSNAPLKKIASKPTSYSMGNLDAVLPKTEEKESLRPATPPMVRRSSSDPNTKEPTYGSVNGDPFPDISGAPNSDFADDVFSFPGGSSSTAASGASTGSADDPFGLSGSYGTNFGSGGDPFDLGGARGKSTNVPQQQKPSSASVADPFDVFGQTKTPSTARKIADPMDSLFTRSTPPPSKAPPPPPAPVQDDGWGMFGGGSSAGTGGSNEPSTTELEGLPPPPNGIDAPSAHEKGSEFYKSGQFPDAIKWLTWSIDLCKTDKKLMVKILTCRSSCFKEIGEMKKAVGDCSKAMELEPKNTIVLMQRANLYESMEKYKLCVADWRMVTKMDPDNRQAIGILARLVKMVEQ